LELRRGDSGENFAVWDGEIFAGTDEVKLHLSTQGEYDRDKNVREAMQNELFAQMPVSTFFDVKAGLRYDQPEGASDWYAMIGLSGLAKQSVELDTNLYLGEDGDFTGDVEAEYELLFTNRLFLTPLLKHLFQPPTPKIKV
jgi:copper resistance protein B